MSVEAVEAYHVLLCPPPPRPPRPAIKREIVVGGGGVILHIQEFSDDVKETELIQGEGGIFHAQNRQVQRHRQLHFLT